MRDLTWLEGLADEPYEPRGILHSEIAFVLHAIRKLNIKTVIESGRARAQSTVMLAKYLPEATIISIESRDNADVQYGIERCKPYKNIRLIGGSAFDVLPHIVAGLDEPLAVLLDGPKGIKACDLLKGLFEDAPHLLLGFIHDMRRLDHGVASEHRAHAVRTFQNRVFTDSDTITRASTWLDKNILAAGGPCGPAHAKEFGSYGPTVGVFYNNQDEPPFGSLQ